MCGRFTLTSSPDIISDYFALDTIFDFEPRYNIAPGQPVYVVREDEHNQREFVPLRWGLIPSWMKEEDISTRLINARAETVEERPAFRHAFKSHRCLIIADGYYEWKKQKQGKQPYYITRKDKKPFGMAGLWERWHSEDNTMIESCTIVTKDADKLVLPVHNRMPVIIDKRNYARWLNHDNNDISALKNIVDQASSKAMMLYPVSTKVNNARYDKPDCVKKLKLPEA